MARLRYRPPRRSPVTMKPTCTTPEQAARAARETIQQHIQQQPKVLDKLTRTEVQIIAERIGLIRTTDPPTDTPP